MSPYFSAPAHKPAVIMDTGQTLTFEELERRSGQLANLLAERGLVEGDRVAFLGENHVGFFETMWAALRSGLYLTAVNWHLSPEETAHIVSNSGAKALVTTAALRSSAEAILPEVPDCQVRLLIGEDAPGFERYETTIADRPADVPTGRRRGDFMLYSSGTTGRPKGVRKPLGEVPPTTHAALSGLFTALVAGATDPVVYLSPAPLYHAAPGQWSATVQELGGTVVVMKRFDAEAFLANVQEHRVTHTQVVPTMFVRMLKLDETTRLRYDVSSIRTAIHAAAPCPPDVKRAMLDWWGTKIDEYYSSTEGNLFTYITGEDWLEHPGSVGRPYLGTPHLCADDGHEVPIGTVGTVYAHRQDSAFEYFRDDGKTASTRHPDHPEWTTIGDVGYVDEDGYLYLTDRRDFVINSGGVNIYPAEIEGALTLHPAVEDIAVFGLPDPEMGEFVQAVVVLAPGYGSTAETAEILRAFARERIAGYKVPRTIDFRDALPRLPTGKLVKGLLREEFITAISLMNDLEPHPTSHGCSQPYTW